MEVQDTPKKTCFVIMPIADAPGYESGHFKRVYEYIIKPACKEAGFEPIRADDVKNTNDIILDILRKIIESDMAICDLSSRNPNVMYELGIRHSFGLPVTLIKDNATGRSFDIQGLRDLAYDESLRIDTVKKAVSELTIALKNTYEAPQGDVNSLIQLLGVQPAKITNAITLDNETSILLNAISSINNRIDSLERVGTDAVVSTSNRGKKVTKYQIGDLVSHLDFGPGVVEFFDDENDPIIRFEYGPMRGFTRTSPALRKITENEYNQLRIDMVGVEASS